MLVNEAMTGKVRWYSPDASMQEVARVMCDEGIGCVPIGENDRPVGMTMDRDGVCAAGTMHAGPFAHLAIDADVPAGLFDEAVDSAESEPCSLAIAFCREKGLEDLGENLLVHAVAGVAQRQANEQRRQSFQIRSSGASLVAIVNLP
ncbi:hypothetical protein NKJ81_22770 [Mesorhizobium sp. M0018]